MRAGGAAIGPRHRRSLRLRVAPKMFTYEIQSETRQTLLFAGVVLLLCPLFALALLELASPLRVDLGPGDRGYVQGFGDWRFQNGDTWRAMSRRSRVALPATLEGPGRFSLEARYRAAAPGRLRVHFDEGAPLEITLFPGNEWQRVSFDLPETRIRANARLRFEAPGSRAERLEIRGAAWASDRPRPSLALLRATVVLLLGSFAAVLLTGAPPRAALGASLLVAAVLLLFAGDSFAVLHLLMASGPPVLAGILIVATARVLRAPVSPGVLLLFLLALAFRAALVFHPAYYFYDLPIHETLVELLYHRGIVDFWTRWPEYHVQYGLGLSIVDGERVPLLYPILFHSIVHLFNSCFHATVLWLKLGLVLSSALAVLPVGYLGRRFSSFPGADLFAVTLYLLVPAFTQSLLLLKFAASFGHWLDLCLVAYLASVSIRLGRRRRWITATLLVTICLVAYNSGFLNVGLLIGACLFLAPLMGGLPRKQALALASAGVAGLLLALACYHPVAVRNFFASLASPSQLPGPSPAVNYSAAAMAVDLLGWPLMALGLLGASRVAPRSSPALRLLLGAWLFSAVAALALRFALPEVLLYHKEHYWVGAVLSVAGGLWLARIWRRARFGPLLATAALLAAASVWLWQLHEATGFFYGPYLFR